MGQQRKREGRHLGPAHRFGHHYLGGSASDHRRCGDACFQLCPGIDQLCHGFYQFDLLWFYRRGSSGVAHTALSLAINGHYYIEDIG